MSYKPIVTLVVPVFNEEQNILPLLHSISHLAETETTYRFEVLFADDGSTDRTVVLIEQFAHPLLAIGYVSLSRNYGHQIALDAGICQAAGDIVITMDGDLQHPPAMVSAMLRAYQQGADIVQMQRANLNSDSKGLLSYMFYSFFSWVSQARVVSNAADFRLMSRRVVNEIKRYNGKDKLLRAIIPQLGFNQVLMPYTQPERQYGEAKYTFFSSYELAVHTVFKFSRFPAHLTTAAGLLLLLAGGMFYLLHFFGLIPDSRQAFFIPLFLLLAGCIFTVGSIISWYLYFILEQVRQEPAYVVKKLLTPPLEKGS